LAKIVFK